MKRPWIITIAVCLLLTAVVAVAVLLPRTVPEAECSDVYRRYAGRDDVAAGYIRDYRINDTVSVDVTVLEAVTDSGWAAMLKDFNIIQPPPEVMEVIGMHGILSKKIPKKNSAEGNDIDIVQYNELSVYLLEKKMYIFHIESEEQIMAVRYKQYDESVDRIVNRQKK